MCIRDSWRTNRCHGAKFRQNWPNGFGDITIFRFSRWPPSVIFYCEIFKFLVDPQIGRPNVHRHTKFHQNRSNGCWDSAFNNYQYGGRPPSWILKFLSFWFPVRLRGLRCIILPNFIKNGQTAAEILLLTFFKMAAVQATWLTIHETLSSFNFYFAQLGRLLSLL